MFLPLGHLLLGLLVAALPWPAAVAGQGDARRYHEQQIVYDQLDSSARASWLGRLLVERAEPAAQIYMDREQLAQLRERHRAILSRAAAGRELSERGLVTLLSEVDRQEQAAIDYLARDYEFATARAFHRNRAEFERWNGAWRSIEREWYQAGRPFSWQPRLIQWLELAEDQYPGAASVAADTPQPSAQRSTRTGAATAEPRTVATPSSAPHFQVGELEARITGFNLEVARLVAQLHEQRQWTATELQRAVDQLSDLATRRADLLLYWRMLPSESPARSRRLEPLDGAIALLAARTSQRRKAVETGGDGSRGDWELRRLEDVSRRLAMLAEPRTSLEPGDQTSGTVPIFRCGDCPDFSVPWEKNGTVDCPLAADVLSPGSS